MIDFHTHILPQMDDGSASIAESIGMLQASQAQGIEALVLTPHFYPDKEDPERFLERRRKSYAMLKSGLVGKSRIPQMHLGAEVAYYEGISRSDTIENLCIGDTGVMLIEMPFCRWTSRMLSELIELKDIRGILPMIAHVERYLHFQNAGMIEEMCNCGLLLQANASFFLGGWMKSHSAFSMLKKGQIHALGSDCHNMRTRKPNMGEAVSRIVSKSGEHAMRHLRHMEQYIFEDME